jgi:hypothetical protein
MSHLWLKHDNELAMSTKAWRPTIWLGGNNKSVYPINPTQQDQWRFAGSTSTMILQGAVVYGVEFLAVFDKISGLPYNLDAKTFSCWVSGNKTDDYLDVVSLEVLGSKSHCSRFEVFWGHEYHLFDGSGITQHIEIHCHWWQYPVWRLENPGWKIENSQ